MKKLKLYLETSVINFIYADDAPEKRDVTIRLLSCLATKADDYSLYISDLVFKEIDRAPEEKKKQLLEVLNKYNFLLLERTEETDILGGKYVEEGLVPEKYIDDAYHIAIASVYDLDAIVSWNFKHIVKMKTIQCIPSVNKLLGYKEIGIYSPEEVLGDVEGE